MGLFRIFNRNPQLEADKRKEEQELFRWCLSQENRKTNIPKEEVDKWFEREDDWRHLEDYGIYIEDRKKYGDSFNPYDPAYDSYFERTYPKEGMHRQEQNRRFLARCREIDITDIEKQKAYGAKQERIRFTKKLRQKFVQGTAVLLIVILAGWGIADYLGLGRHTIKLDYLFEKYIVTLFVWEKNYSLNGTITNNPEGRKMMYMAFQKSDNIFDTLYIDSARIINGKFAFKGKVPYPAQAFLSTTVEGVVYSHPSTTSIVYLDTTSPIQCEINLDSPGDVVVKGSVVNDDWQKVSKMLWEDVQRRREPDYATAFRLLPIKSPVNFELLRIFIFGNKEGNLAYVKKRFSEMSWTARSSPAGLRLWKIIDRAENTGRIPAYIPEFKVIDIEGNTVESGSLIGKDGGMVIIYFWIPGGEYTKFGDYQEHDFAQLQAIYDSSPKGSVSIVTICASGNPDKLIEWKAIIPKYAGKEGWTNLRYYVDPDTFEVGNVYDKMYLEGKLPVTLLISPWRCELIYLEGSIDPTSAGIIKDYANWSYKYIMPYIR